MQESVLKMCLLLIAWTADRLFSTGAHRKKCIFPLEWRSRQPSFDCARPCFHTSVPKWISCVPVQGGLIHFEESELKRKKKRSELCQREWRDLIFKKRMTSIIVNGLLRRCRVIIARPPTLGPIHSPRSHAWQIAFSVRPLY